MRARRAAGFIPACAGNTVRAHTRGPDAPVHPRLCGEHFGDLTVKAGVTGSSPPVRGTRKWAKAQVGYDRFIPACAGEHVVYDSVSDVFYGSSPPVRGTRSYALRLTNAHRFIPACAGNTWRRLAPACRNTVHPRLCGEHPPWNPTFGGISGSSPPVRGTHAKHSTRSLRPRFIPACAGNTWLWVTGSQPSAVHPRLCGEHSLVTHGDFPSTGSSPPVRGTLALARRLARWCRFIPACAGNTERDSRPG